MDTIEDQAPELLRERNAIELLPPPTRTDITVYKARRQRKPWSFWRVLRWGLFVMLLLAAAAGALIFHYFYEPLAQVTDISGRKDLQEAQQFLIAPAPNRPVTGLVIGYDARPGENQSRSDTLMLVRFDPERDTLSLLSVPRDLRVAIPGHGIDKINAAYSIGKTPLALRTIQANFVGVDINYIISVDFRGFKGAVNAFGGVWIPIDRRYFNDNAGTAGTNFSDIDLKPGYQKLNGPMALAYARYRHTDTDIFRLARQQVFVREFKRQMSGWNTASRLPELAVQIGENVKIVGAKGNKPGPNTMLQYARALAGVPRGNTFQYRVEGEITGNDVTASQAEIDRAVASFEQPDLTARDAVAKRDVRGKDLSPSKSPARKTIPPERLRIATLNGSGEQGDATLAMQQLRVAGWKKARVGKELGEGNVAAEYFSSVVYYTSPAARSAARKLQGAIGESELWEKPLPVELAPFRKKTDVVLIVGEQFAGATAPDRPTALPKVEKPLVVKLPETFETARGSVSTMAAFRDKQRKLGFPILYPSVIPTGTEIGEPIDVSQGPLRHYRLGDKGMAMHMTSSSPGGDARYTWGVQWLDWDTPPILDEPTFKRRVSRREWRVYLSDGGRIHRIRRAERGLLGVDRQLAQRPVLERDHDGDRA